MIERIWNNIIKHAGEEFKTASGLPFTYIIRDDHTIIPARHRASLWHILIHGVTDYSKETDLTGLFSS